MLHKISQELKEKIRQFPASDKIIFNNRLIEVDKANFEQIPENFSSKTIAFVDGGQAEILSAGNFCLSFIRVGALAYSHNKKVSEYLHEFYLLITAKYENNDLLYEAKIFSSKGEKIIDESDLAISSIDNSIKTSQERASITQVTGIARRFAELALAATVSAEIILLDGTLEPSYRHEEKYLDKLPENVCALAKSSSLFTASGNSPLVLLNKLSPPGCWIYLLEKDSYFVKLHEKAKHVFRFTGNKESLPSLRENSTDALFLGYPYGLIAVDKLARVSHEEKKALKMNFLLKSENREIAEYLSATNAHDILDNLG
ncbi:MAG: hypothetical protein Q8R47_00985 [Nanoarchaeota archaeon]|nr:hypothetical protein [Nanoarchaeota archaeon]